MRPNVRPLTIGYLAALTLIALLSISSYFIMSHIIMQSRNDAPLINLSGRQRMLSQKLAKEVLLISQSRDVSKINTLRQQLNHTFETWSRVHARLRSGDRELQLSGGNSQAVQDMYRSIDDPFNNIRRILDMLKHPGESAGPNRTGDVVANTERYMEAMDRIVAQYALEAGQRVERLKMAEGFVLTAVLLLLVLETLIIFRPLTGRINKLFKELNDTNRRLQEALENVKTLKGLLPICASCKKIRDEDGRWHQMELYVRQHSPPSSDPA